MNFNCLKHKFFRILIRAIALQNILIDDCLRCMIVDMIINKNDLILIAAMTCISLAPLTLPTVEKDSIAEIKLDGKLVRTIDPNSDQTFDIETSAGRNTIRVEGGAISMIDADCPDKICVRTGAIKNVGETVACIPHGLLIELK